MYYKVENFKSLKKTGNIEISSLTVFIGPNGTGKSSAIQPLLLLSQTMTNCRDDVGFLSNGEYIRIGNYYDFVNGHDTKKKLKIFFDFGLNYKNCRNKEAEIIPNKQNKDMDLGELPPEKYEIIFKCGKDNQPELEKIIIFDGLNRELLTRKKNGGQYYSLDFYTSISDLDKIIFDLIKKQMPQNFIFNDNEIIDCLYQDKSNREKYFGGKGLKFEKTVSNYLNILLFNKQNILTNLAKIKYVGPIREEAKRVYEYNKETFIEVGRFGEATASLVFQNDKQIEKKDELLKWLRIFGLADDFKIALIPNHPELFMLEFKENGKDYYINYADSCFGLSQIFPLLVQSVFSEANDIIIIEQPELYLNPKLESILADFFIDMINKKKRLIVETHSEYLLIRLRTYIKTGKLNNKKIALYFTENINGNSEIRKINIDENGDFPDNDWPVGFFEQALSENMMFATAVKQ